MPSTTTIYYLETNLICWCFIAFVFFSYIREEHGKAESKWFIALLATGQMYCLADIFAALFKQETMMGARAILWIANVIYVATPLILVVLWNQYVKDHIRVYYQFGRFFRTLDWLMSCTAVALCIYVFLTPLTHSVFYIDAQNLYHRAAGAYYIPAFAYLFMIFVTVKLQIIRHKTDSLQIKRDANILSVFAVPCIFFSLAQVLLYGITLSQVGFTMAIMIVFLTRQRNRVSKDELTGVNNRREYDYSIDRMARSSGTAMIMMVDADDFKSINDRYGHQEGDVALQSIAKILKEACSNREELGNIALFRYGGDEFVMLLADAEDEGIQAQLVKAINTGLEAYNRTSGKKYRLSVSIGSAFGQYSGSEIYQLIKQADSNMYRQKSISARKSR